MTSPKNEKTLVILKPDAVQRGLMGEIIKRIENTGLKLVALKMVMAEEAQCWEHYNKDDKWFLSKGTKVIENRQSAGLLIEKEAIEYGRDIIGALAKFMTCGPIVPMIFQGNQSVGVVKKLVGSTEPMSSDGGTIRGDYTIDSFELANFDSRAVRNLIHCSDEVSEAAREIKIWFNESELLKYTLVNEKILYDVNLDGIKE